MSQRSKTLRARLLPLLMAAAMLAPLAPARTVHAVSFSNPDSINVPDNSPATPYPATINVAGLAGTITKITVTLRGLSHTRPDDFDIILVGPAGQKVVLMSDAGGANLLVAQTLTFSDDAAVFVPDSGFAGGGTYLPTNYEVGENLPAPAPPGPYFTNFSQFIGADPNGTYSLFVADDLAGEPAGGLDAGFSIDIETTGGGGPPPSGTIPADLRITKTDNATSVVPGGTVTYTIAVTNGGAVPVSGVTVADTFDATRLSGPSTTCVAGAGSSCPAGPTSGNLNATVTLAPNGTATFTTTATVLAGASGTLTNTATVAPPPGVTDPNPANNTATDTTAIGAGAPNADVSITASDAPDPVSAGGSLTYTVRARNAGPTTAPQARIILKLPGTVTAGSGTLSGGGTCTFESAAARGKATARVFCTVGDLASGAEATATVAITAPGAGPLDGVARAKLAPPTADPNPSNNQVPLRTTVNR